MLYLLSFLLLGVNCYAAVIDQQQINFFIFLFSGVGITIYHEAMKDEYFYCELVTTIAFLVNAALGLWNTYLILSILFFMPIG